MISLMPALRPEFRPDSRLLSSEVLKALTVAGPHIALLGEEFWAAVVGAQAGQAERVLWRCALGGGHFGGLRRSSESIPLVADVPGEKRLYAELRDGEAVVPKVRTVKVPPVHCLTPELGPPGGLLAVFGTSGRRRVVVPTADAALSWDMQDDHIHFVRPALWGSTIVATDRFIVAAGPAVCLDGEGAYCITECLSVFDHAGDPTIQFAPPAGWDLLVALPSGDLAATRVLGRGVVGDGIEAITETWDITTGELRGWVAGRLLAAAGETRAYVLGAGAGNAQARATGRRRASLSTPQMGGAACSMWILWTTERRHVCYSRPPAIRLH